MSEMPLVIFTVLSQLAVGATISLWFLDSFKRKIPGGIGSFITGSLFCLTGVSILISLFHLGHPFGALMAFSNFGESWLSREVVLFTIFLATLGWYYLQWKSDKVESRKTIGGVASLMGLLAIVASGMVYVLPAVPAWHNLSPVIFFLFTAALLGPLYVVGLLFVKGEKDIDVAGIMTAVVLFYGVGFALYISTLLAGGATLELTANSILGSSTFWLRMLLSWLIPLFLFGSLYLRRQMPSSNALFMGLGAALIGELIGRELFYSTVVMLQVGLF